MPIASSAIRALDERHIPYRVFEHAQPPTSLEQAADERGQVPGQIVRSILFQAANDVNFITLMAGPG